MELDDLKNAWAQYDKKLSDNLKFNEKMLKKMNLNSSKLEMQKPLIYEFINISIMFVVVVFAIAFSIKLIEEPKFYIPGLFSALIGLIYLIFAIVKVKTFLNIDYYKSPILKLQKDVTLLNKLVLRLRKIELVLFPFLIMPLLPLLFKVIHNVNIYSNIRLFSIELILILGISIPISLWLNKHLYDKKFKQTENLLKELEKFEVE